MNIYEKGEYLEKNPDWHESDSLWKSGHILALMDENKISPDSICEVGCGAGAILAHLSRAMRPGTRLIGYDISADAIAKCQKYKNPDLNFVHGDFFKMNSTYFDVVMAIDVAEHVEDYMGFIRKIRECGDYKVFHFPLELSVNKTARKNALISSRQRLGHLHYFSKETALATLKDCNHEIIDYCYTNSLDAPDQPIMTRLCRPIIKLNFWVNQDFAARLWGGYSLIVLTR